MVVPYLAINGLSILAQKLLSQEFANGAMFVFRGKRADKVKILWWDGQVVSRSTHGKHCSVCML